MRARSTPARSAIRLRRTASVLCALGVLASADSARAIVFTDDPNFHVVAADSPLRWVGYLSWSGGISAAAIGPWHVLTAAHAVGGAATFTVSGADGEVSYTFAAGSAWTLAGTDLAVVRLDTPLPFAGYGLCDTAPAAGTAVTMAGYGVSGIDRPQPDWPRGVLRAGENTIDSVGSKNLLTDFDVGECMFAPGDSGGPTFVTVGGELRIAGVHSALRDANGDGVVPDVGDVGIDWPVYGNAAWIRDILAAWSPPAGDATLDGVVNGSDLAVLAGSWGQNGAWADGDFNADGVVNAADLAALASNWTPSPASSSAASADESLPADPASTPAPEPSALLVLAAGAALLRRRR